jgi:hypothetical protein
VQGTFFETIPNQELLKSLWKDLLEQSGVPIEQHEEILDYLAKLERNEVAKSRKNKASRDKTAPANHE